MDLGQFTWANAIALASLLLVGLSALLGVWYRLYQSNLQVQSDCDKKVSDTRSDCETKIAAVRAECANKVAGVERELHEFRLHVVEKYASWDTVDKAHKRLEDRIEKMAQDVNQMPDILVDRIMRFLDLKK